MSSTVLEDVARIIDPEPWAQVDRWYVHGERVNVDRSIVKPSVDKARTILALIPGRDEAALPEAVAWRWRLFHPNSASGPIWGPWYVGPSKPEFRADIRSEVEPLYAAPPPPPVGGQAGDDWKAKAEEFAQVAMGNGVEIGRLHVVIAKLGNALAKLTDACHLADAGEGLSEEIDGSLLDEAEEAIALIERFPPPRVEIPEEE